MVILYLTCANDSEAKQISQALLQTRLVSCVRRWPVDSLYWWNGEINNDSEVILMMESVEEKFDQINKVVEKLHSYDEYVLTMVRVDKTTPGVHKWLKESLK